MKEIKKSHTSSKFEKNFKNLPREIQKRAKDKIFLFEKNPDHPSLNTHKLKGDLSGLWSFYITESKYRVLFRFLPDNEVIYYDIGDHDIYD